MRELHIVFLSFGSIHWCVQCTPRRKANVMYHDGVISKALCVDCALGGVATDIADACELINTAAWSDTQAQTIEERGFWKGR